MNTAFFDGMTHADQIGMITIALFIVLVVMVCLLIIASDKRDNKNRIGNDWNAENLRSPDRQYNRMGNAPTSDSGFGSNRSAAIVQDPAGYWRTAQAYEPPIGYAHVPSQRRQLALTAMAHRATGYRTDPRQTTLLGLQEPLDVIPLSPAPAPMSPPMYPITPAYAPIVEDYYSVAPTSPAAPTASSYAPRSVSMAPEAPRWNDYSAPQPVFNPLGQQYTRVEVKAAGRHSRLNAPGTATQRALSEKTGALDLSELRELLAVG